MIFSLNNNCLQRLIMMLLVSLLAACSDGVGSDPAGTNLTSTPLSPAPLNPATVEPQAAPSNTVNFEYLLNADLDALRDYSDRDGDGIHDDVDVYPDTAPSLRDPTAGYELTIEHTWTAIDGQRVINTAIEDLPLKVTGLGFADAATNPDVWLVFMTEYGRRALRTKLNSDGSLSAVPPTGVSSVHVVIGLSRSVEVSIESLLASAPMLFENTAALPAGENIKLAGRNLSKIDSVLLGSEQLGIVASSETEITVQIPVVPITNRLVVYAGKTKSNSVALDLRHEVELVMGTELTLKSGEELALWVSGNSYRIDSNKSALVSLSAYQPVVLFFDVISSTGNARLYNRVLTVVWPGDQTVMISPESTLLGRLVIMRRVLSGSAGDNYDGNWTIIHDALSDVLSMPSAATFTSGLQQLLANEQAFPQENIIIAVVAEYQNMLDQQSTTLQNSVVLSQETTSSSLLTSQPMAARYTTFGGELDDVIGATVTYAGEGPDADDPVGADYVYPVQTTGNDYAQFVIVPHGDRRIISPTFNPFSVVCAFSPVELAKKPQILWDSDLCIQLDGIVFASAAVFKPGVQGINESYQPVDGSSDQVRRHAIPKFLDDHILGEGGHYLKDDNGRALCNMESCYVEIITSGYGAYYKVALTQAQQALVDTLRVRMWTDAFVPAMLNMVGVALDISNSDVESCLKKEILKSGELYAEVALLQDKIFANKNKTGTELVSAVTGAVDETLGKWARKFVKGEINLVFYNCVKDYLSPEKQIAREFNKIIVDALKSNDALNELKGGLFQFAEVVSYVRKLGSVVLTPEKIVFRMDPRARIIGIEPRDIDLFNLDDQITPNLDILGSWIAEKPCDTTGWCPELVFRDRYGKEYIYQVTESNIVPAPGNTGPAFRKISIPLTDLHNGLQTLTSGPLAIKLAINDPDYVSYNDTNFGPASNGKLPVPVSGKVVNLLAKTKIFAFDPPLAQANEAVTVIGSRLSAYGDAPIFELDNLNNSFPVQLQRAGSSLNPDEAVKLKLPALATGQYHVTIKPDPALNSNLPPIVSEGTLLVSNGTQLPAVVVGDFGSVKDDSFIVKLLDSKGNPVKDPGNSLAPLQFVIPTEIREPVGRFTDAIYWDDNDVPNTLSADVEKISVTCTNSGADDTCTYGIRLIRDRLCAPGWTTPRSSYAAKLSEGETHTYYIAIEPDALTNCASVINALQI